jgi:hypothetical protein
MPNALNATLCMKQWLMYLMCAGPPSSNEPCWVEQGWGGRHLKGCCLWRMLIIMFGIIVCNVDHREWSPLVTLRWESVTHITHTHLVFTRVEMWPREECALVFSLSLLVFICTWSFSLMSCEGLLFFLEYLGASWKSRVRVYTLEVWD